MADFNPKTIKGNIGGVYFTKTKEAVDPFNLTKYNPNTNQNIILFYLEDGVENNIVTVNFAPNDSSMPKKGWTSHDFPAIFRGYVDHTVNGEAIPRTFAQYLALVPTLITDLNLNNKNPLSFNATVIQQSGVNLLGSFNTLNDLINAHTPTESLHDNDAIAYVYENGQNGFYKVYFSSASSTWYWGVYQGAISTSLSEVQYNLTGLQVQGGFRNPAPIVPLQDEQYRIIWQHLNELYAQYSVIEGELGDLEQEIIELNTAVVKTISKTDTNTIIIGLTRIDNAVNIHAVVNVSSNSYNLLKVVDSYGLEVNPEDIINEIVFEINNTNSTLRQAIDNIVDSKITAHNINSEAHQDIRDDIETAEQNANEYTDEEVAKKVDLIANQNIGGIKNFTDSLNYKGKQVLTTETGNIYSQQIADLQANKLNKIWADITEQATTNLTDILVFNRGSNVYKTTIANLLAQVDTQLYLVVAELPTTGNPNKIYLVPSSDPKTQNTLDEFIWVNNDWEKIGSVSVDLSDYFNKTDINSLLGNKVDKVTGKGLSTEDYTSAEKTKLSGIEAGAQVNVQSDWSQEVNTADDYIKNKPAIPTKTSDLTNDTGYITEYTETDPIFTAWDKSTGINITKSQVSDFSHTHNDLYYNKDYIDNLYLGVEYKGAWVNGSNYKKGDIVYSNENDDTKGFVYLFHTDKNNSTLLPETIDGYCINLNAFTNKAKRIKLPDYSGGATTKGALVATHPSSTYYGDGDQEHRKTFYLDDIYWLKDANGNFHLYDSRGKLASISELFSGSYNDLTDKPTLFSGNYDDLTNKPTIPTKTSDLTNDSGFATETWVNQKVSSVYKYKGSVATYSNLPTTGLTIGDVYDIQSNGMNYAWTGTSWDALGMTIDLSNYHTKNEIATILLDYLKNKGTVVINPADNVSDPILKLKLLADESSKIEFTNEDNGQIAKQKMVSKGNELNIKVPKINTGYTEFDTTVAGFKAITKSNDNTNKRTIFFDNDLWTPDTLLRLGRPLSPFGKAYIEKINNITIPSILDSESDTLAKLSDLASYTKFKGNYTGTTTYKKDEIVKSNNYYYISLQDNNSGNTPNTSPTFWANLNEYADKSALVNILKRTSLVEKRKVLFGNANGYETPLFYDGIYQENGELYDSRGKLASQTDITDVITENITHANLKTKVANSELFPNRKYRIIDYETTGSNVAGHLFDIVLQASSSNTFYEVASAVERSGETYFANRNAKLYEWQIWYDINGNGKGTITRMIDEHGNDLPYDFKNMLFKRYKATSVDVPNMATELAYLVGTYYATQDETPIFSFDSNDYQDFYTFSHYVNGVFVDGSLYSKARNNKITNPETQPNYSVGNIFFGYAGGNTIHYSRYNTFIGVTTANDFTGVDGNVFGDGCNYNKIFGNFFENYIGSNFENNIFDNGTHNFNMIKKDFKKNTISGGDSYFNKIDEGFEKNNAVSVWQSTFGKNIKWNNFNNDITQVILVSGVKYNVFNKSLEYVKIDYTPQTNDEVKNIIVDCELKGVAPNHINLYFTGLENRTYKTTYDLASNGNIVAVHQDNNVKRLGKYLNDNTDTTWKDIPDTLGGGLNVETWNTATKTLALSDANKLFKCTHTANQTLTIPTNATVAFPIGTMISFLLTSTYKVTFSGASGVTLTSIDSLVELATQFAMASLIKTDTNTWQLVGALE